MFVEFLKKSKFSLFLIIGILISCQSLPELNEPISFERGTTYGKSTDSDKHEIEELFQKLVQSVIAKNMELLASDIHPSLGVWVDLKAQWTKDEFIQSFQEPENYFEIYFYSTAMLRAKKKSEISWAVRDILILAKGIQIDYYFESKDECELDLHFQEMQELEGDLANPVFRKVGGKWYIYRLF